jgi:hypothetical protein
VIPHLTAPGVLLSQPWRDVMCTLHCQGRHVTCRNNTAG